MNISNLDIEQKEIYLKSISEVRKLVENRNKWLALKIDFDELFNHALENLVETEKIDPNNFKSQMTRFYQEEFDKIILENLASDHNHVFFNKFLNRNFSLANDRKGCEKALTNLIIAFQKIGYELTYDECFYLVSNSKIESAVKRLITGSNGKINQLYIMQYESESLFTLIEPYCEKNNIIIEDEEYSLEGDVLVNDDVLTTDATHDFLKQLPSEVLSHDELVELMKRKESGDQYAKDKIIKHNLRLVVSIAKRYIGHGVPLLDLIQEGSMGLMKAVDRYNYNVGTKFSTYATWWIRQAITRSIADSGKTIRVPVHMIETLNKFYQAEKSLEQELGRKPTNSELAKEMGVSEQKIEEYVYYSQDTISYDMKVSDEEDSELQDFIPDTDTDIEGEIFRKQLRVEFQKYLDELQPRERFVLEKRFGLNGEKVHTLEEVGKMMNVTRERIRQIEAKAIRKLRYKNGVKALRIYLDNTSDVPSPVALSNGGNKYLFDDLRGDRELTFQAISYLAHYEKSFLTSIYGENLNLPQRKIQDSNRYTFIINKVKLYRTALTKNGSIPKISGSLLELLSIDKQDLFAIVRKLNIADQNLLIKKYKGNLLGTDVEQLKDPYEYYLYSYIIPQLRSLKDDLLREKRQKIKKTIDSRHIDATCLRRAFYYLSTDIQLQLKKYGDTLFNVDDLEALIIKNGESKIDVTNLELLYKCAQNIHDTNDPERSIDDQIPLHELLDTTMLDIAIATTYLSNKEKELLIKRYGMNYVYDPEYHKITYLQSHEIFYKIIPKLRRIIQNNNMSLTMKCGTSLKAIGKALFNLSEEERRLIMTRHGLTFNDQKELVYSEKIKSSLSLKQEKEILDVIIPKLRQYAINIERERQNQLKHSVNDDQKESNAMSALEFYHTDELSLSLVLENLIPREREVFYKRFDHDLSKPVNSSKLTPSEQRFFKTITDKINSGLNNLKLNGSVNQKYTSLKNSPIVELIKENPDLAKQAYEYLTPKERDILKKRLGEDYLNNPIDIKIGHVDNSAVAIAVRHFGRYISDLKNSGKVSVITSKGKSENIVKLVLNEPEKAQMTFTYLTANEKAILREIYGSEFPQKLQPMEDLPSAEAKYGEIIAKYWKNLNQLVKDNPQAKFSVPEIINLVQENRDVIPSVLNKMMDTDKRLLEVRLGKNYASAPVDLNVPSIMQEGADYVLEKYQRLLKEAISKKEKKASRVKLNVHSTAIEKIENAESLRVMYKGVNEEKPQVEFTDQDYEEAIEMCHNPLFKNLLVKVPAMEATVLSLKFGFNRGKKYTDSSLAKKLQISEKELHAYYLQGLDYLHNFVDEVLPAGEKEPVKILEKMINYLKRQEINNCEN